MKDIRRGGVEKMERRERDLWCAGCVCEPGGEVVMYSDIIFIIYSDISPLWWLHPSNKPRATSVKWFIYILIFQNFSTKKALYFAP